MVRPSVVKPNGLLKIQEKVRIIKLHAEEGHSLGMRKFTDLVEIKLGLTVSRATILSNFQIYNKNPREHHLVMIKS